MFEDRIAALNHAREMGTTKKKKPAAKTTESETEQKTTTTPRTYSPPKPVNSMQSIDLNQLVRALQIVMYGEKEDYQDIDSSQIQVYEVSEIQKMLGISRPSVYEMLKKGEIPCVKAGKGWKIPKKAFHEWLNNSRYETEDK